MIRSILFALSLVCVQEAFYHLARMGLQHRDAPLTQPGPGLRPELAHIFHHQCTTLLFTDSVLLQGYGPVT